MTAKYDDVPPPDEEPGRVATHPIGVVATHSENRKSEAPGRNGATQCNSPDSCNPVATELRAAYFDVAAFFAKGQPETPAPEVCRRTDGTGLFYRHQFNLVFGDFENGKTLLADHTTVAELIDSGKVLRLDFDHNSHEASLSRLLRFGASETMLADQKRFLYVEPEHAMHVTQIVDDMATWLPTLVVVDSVGELLPMYKASSNSADEYTDVHSRVIKPLVMTGAAVVGIDHLSRSAESRQFGPTGTAAKGRVIGGTSIRFTVDEPFTPGKGGSAWLKIHKDRNGGLRRESPIGDREPLAGKFEIEEGEGTFVSRVKAPAAGQRNPDEIAPAEDVASIDNLDPAPVSARDARERLGWADKRARMAFKTWHNQKENG